MRAFLGALLTVTIFAACGGDSFEPAAGFGAATIEVADSQRTVELKVEVASEPESRIQGLMFRQELPDGEGMLFIYPAVTGGGHWMKDTYLPLDVAYANGFGEIFNVLQGRPLDTTVLSAGAPFLYVLEVPAGWFEEHGFGPGSRLVLPDNLPVAR